MGFLMIHAVSITSKNFKQLSPCQCFKLKVSGTWSFFHDKEFPTLLVVQAYTRREIFSFFWEIASGSFLVYAFFFMLWQLFKEDMYDCSYKVKWELENQGKPIVASTKVYCRTAPVKQLTMLTHSFLILSAILTEHNMLKQMAKMIFSDNLLLTAVNDFFLRRRQNRMNIFILFKWLHLSYCFNVIEKVGYVFPYLQ